MSQKLQTETSNSFYQRLVDATTKDKIRKHLTDRTDVITEEDIKNIRTDIFFIPFPTLSFSK